MTSEAPLAAPLPAVGSGSLSGIGLQGGGANGLQSSNPDGHHAAGQPYAPPQSGLPQSAKRHSEASEEHVLAVLRQLLPASESEAVTLTSAFDRALEVRLHFCWLHSRPVHASHAFPAPIVLEAGMCAAQAQLVPLSWACDFAPVYGSVMNFMAQRQQLFMQRRVDGFWYMPQQVPSGHGSASFPAFRSQTGARDSSFLHPCKTSTLACVLDLICAADPLYAVSALYVTDGQLILWCRCRHQGAESDPAGRSSCAARGRYRRLSHQSSVAEWPTAQRSAVDPCAAGATPEPPRARRCSSGAVGELYRAREPGAGAEPGPAGIGTAGAGAWACLTVGADGHCDAAAPGGCKADGAASTPASQAGC